MDSSGCLDKLKEFMDLFLEEDYTRGSCVDPLIQWLIFKMRDWEKERKYSK